MSVYPDGRSVGSDDEDLVAGDGRVEGEAKVEHPASPLAGLRAKREAAIAELFIDLAVPDYLERLGVDLYVRYRPIPLSTAVKLREQMGRTKAPERHANANAAALATACEGIYYLLEGEERPFRDDGDSTWPAFEPIVAETLGVSWINPTRLVRDLYFTDDHVAACVQRIDSWATGEVRERQKDDSGN